MTLRIVISLSDNLLESLNANLADNSSFFILISPFIIRFNQLENTLQVVDEGF